MRILLLSQWFQPEPIFKGLPFAKALAKLGHEVQVLTGFPNYPEGKIYDGYKLRMLQREDMDNISVVRVPLYASHDTSGFRRMINYGSFALSAATIGTAVVKRPDVVYVYHPPATVGLPATTLRLLRGVPFVYDIQDLWPDTLTATGMFNNARGISIVDKWCKYTYRMASRIVVLSPGFKKKLIERGVPENKIDVIYNWCEDSVFNVDEDDGTIAREYGLDGRFNIVFAGTMGKAQALDAVIDAAALLSEKAHDVQFVLVGGGIDVDRLKSRTAEMGLTNVKFIPRMPFSEVGKVLKLADVLLVHLCEDPLFHITIPSKTQAYMAVGKPILMGVRGDAADMVTQAGAGICCMPENPSNIADSVIQLAKMSEEERKTMGRNGRAFYDSELAMEIGVKKFEECFQSVIQSKK